MKIFQAILVITIGGFFGGCAVTEQSTQDVGRQVQQGLTGNGHIVGDKPMSDSYGSDFH